MHVCCSPYQNEKTKKNKKKKQHKLKSKTKCDDVLDELDQSIIECISLWPLKIKVKYCRETTFWC